MPTAKRVLPIALLAASILLPFGAAAGAGPGGGARLAFVVAEGSISGARLPTADADAGLVATALAQTGFDVTALADVDLPTLRKAVATFAAKARAAGPDAALVVYVEGYGLQYDGENRLLPAGTRIAGDDAVPDATLRLAELTGPLEQVPAALRLFLFDVAHPAPFPRDGLSLASGLALVQVPPGSAYGFNAAPGTVAPADVPPYGAYARAVAEAMQGPGLSPGALLRRVRLRVAERTDAAVLPYDDGAGDAGFAFLAGPPIPATPLPAMAGATAAAAFATTIARDTLPGYSEWLAAWPADPLAGRVLGMAAARREALIWSEAVRANTPRAYWTYQRRYPRGPHRGDARRRLFALHAALEPPPRFEVVSFEGLPPPPAAELAFVARPDPTFADADGPPMPNLPTALVPASRNAFFETLAPPPIAPPGALPLPLPVALPDRADAPLGRIEQPAPPGGPLATSLRIGRDGPELVTTDGTGAMMFRVSAGLEHRQRDISQVAASGAIISRVSFAVGADGAVTVTRFGPANAVLERWETREGANGTRTTTMFDAANRAVAISRTSAGDVVTASATTGVPFPPRYVLAATPDSKTGPVLLAAQDAPEARTRATEPRATEIAAPVAPTGGKAPALPAASGLTGEVPKLDLPPAPATPAFDAAAAPVASPASSPQDAAPKPIDAKAATAKPDGAAPSASETAASAHAKAPPAAASAGKAAQAAATTGSPDAGMDRGKDRSALPSDPPLPPSRAHGAEPKGRHRSPR